MDQAGEVDEPPICRARENGIEAFAIPDAISVREMAQVTQSRGARLNLPRVKVNERARDPDLARGSIHNLSRTPHRLTVEVNPVLQCEPNG